MSKSRYLIIGNSAAAVGAVTGIREVDAEGAITVVSREPEQTYSRPLISYLLAGKVDETRMYYRPADFYEKNRVNALLGVEATKIDTKKGAVKTSGGETLEFEKLLIATGGKPVVPGDVKGLSEKSTGSNRGIFTFTSWQDARDIQAYIEDNKVNEAVVVGGGLIGLKSIEALVALGIKTTVVELMDRILSATFDDRASDMAKGLLEKAGVKVFCGTTLAEVFPAKGKVTSVTLKNGSEVPCDLLIVAIGVTPDAGMARDAGIETDRGIIVDEYMRTSEQGVYAAGDVAQAAEILSGQKRAIPILPNAYRQGYIAGMNMAGKKREYEGGLAMNSIDICGVPTISVGMTSPEEAEGYEVLSEIKNDKYEYRKIVLKENRIAGAIFIGGIDRAGIFTGLIKNKVDVSGFKDLLLSEDFGVITLPEEYRKEIMSGAGTGA